MAHAIEIVMNPFDQEGMFDIRLNVDEAHAIKARDALLTNAAPFCHAEDRSADCDVMSVRAMVRDCPLDAVVEQDIETGRFYISARGFTRQENPWDDLDGTLPAPAQVSSRDIHDASWLIREILAQAG